jgi:hypothetical protein
LWLRLVNGFYRKIFYDNWEVGERCELVVGPSSLFPVQLDHTLNCLTSVGLSSTLNDFCDTVLAHQSRASYGMVQKENFCVIIFTSHEKRKEFEIIVSVVTMIGQTLVASFQLR